MTWALHPRRMRNSGNRDTTPVSASCLHTAERARLLVVPQILFRLEHTPLSATLSFLCEASSFPTLGKSGRSLLHSLSTAVLRLVL